MKYLGIDFGGRRVGIAVSDIDGKIAFPLIVLPNDKSLFRNIMDACIKDDINTVVMGESLNYQGQKNEIMTKIEDFRKLLEIAGVKVILEPEFMTSVQASRVTGENQMLDAAAAAIILQSYLDKNNNKKVEENILAVEKIKYEDWKKIEIKIGKILNVEKIEKSDKLLKLSVDFAETTGPRQIVSGIAKYFPNIEYLINKKCAFVTNLEPKPLMDLESNGMILAVGGGEEPFSLFEVKDEVIIGTQAK